MSTIEKPEIKRSSLSTAKRIVIKVGSSLLTDLELGLNRGRITDYSAQIVELIDNDREVVLVSSGAIAEGCVRLGWSERPEEIAKLQAAAAVGQMGLTQAYETALGQMDRKSAIVMLTHEDIADRQRYLNAKSALVELMSLGVIPVINENDSVATEEIRFGDNDTLAAMVSSLIEADLLVLLTDVDGLFESDPKLGAAGELIDSAFAADAQLDNLPSKSKNAMGRGGMVSKIKAARIAAAGGAHTIIASGRAKDSIRNILHGQQVGTLLAATTDPLTARKRWISSQKSVGKLIIDQGAVTALIDGKSLLPIGVTSIEGNFSRGDIVSIYSVNGRELAKGICAYPAVEAKLIIGQNSNEIEKILGYAGRTAVVHRDDLAI